MRDYAKAGPTWTDFRGTQWPLITSVRRLKFSYPAHAAIRAHIFHVDGYKCRQCGLAAIKIPDQYTGRKTLVTDRKDAMGYAICLVVDHITCLQAGGINELANFQTLCEICNLRKGREDKLAVTAWRSRQ